MKVVERPDALLMARAMVLARAAVEAGEVPVGALLVDAHGSTLAEAANCPIANHDPTAHAEIEVLRKAGAATGN